MRFESTGLSYGSMPDAISDIVCSCVSLFESKTVCLAESEIAKN